MEEKETVSTEETTPDTENQEEQVVDAEQTVAEKETGKKKSDSKKCKAELAKFKDLPAASMMRAEILLTGLVCPARAEWAAELWL